jgi:hypothetical protein
MPTTQSLGRLADDCRGIPANKRRSYEQYFQTPLRPRPRVAPRTPLFTVIPAGFGGLLEPGLLPTASRGGTRRSVSFNGKFRDECLNLESFRNRAEARVLIEQWRLYYNSDRTHSSLGYRTPFEFKQQLQQFTPTKTDHVILN